MDPNDPAFTKDLNTGEIAAPTPFDRPMPEPEKPGFMDTLRNASGDQWASAIQGMGAGFQGRGSEWRKDFMLQNEQRRKAMLKDARSTLLHLENGDEGSARELLQRRLAAIQKLGGDPTDTMEIMTRIESGDVDGAMQELSVLDRAAVAAGEMEPIERGDEYLGEKNGVAIMRGRDGQVYGQPITGMPGGAGKPESFSASTERYKNGLSVMFGNNGSRRAFIPGVGETTDPAKIDEAVAAANDYDIMHREALARAEASGGAAVRQAAEMFEQLPGIQEGIAMLDEGIELLESADAPDTGPIWNMLPSVRTSAIELDQLQARMGLNVIQNTTFGSLSQEELKFALNTALPQNLPNDELLTWMKRKKAAQQKLHGYLQRALVHREAGGSLQDFIEQEKARNAALKAKAQAREDEGDKSVEVIWE